MDMLDRLAAWVLRVAEARRRAPTRAQIEAAEAERERQRIEHWQDEVAQNVVENGGAWFPDDLPGSPRRPESWPGAGPGTWWVRW